MYVKYIIMIFNLLIVAVLSYLLYYILYGLYSMYHTDRASLEDTLSRNFDIVKAEYIEGQVCKRRIGKTVLYIPYIRYKYTVDDVEYIGDNYQYPEFQGYDNTADVMRLIRSYTEDLSIFVKKDLPSVSYIAVFDYDTNKKISDLSFSYVAPAIIAIMAYVTLTVQLLAY